MVAEEPASVDLLKEFLFAVLEMLPELRLSYLHSTCTFMRPPKDRLMENMHPCK